MLFKLTPSNSSPNGLISLMAGCTPCNIRLSHFQAVRSAMAPGNGPWLALPILYSSSRIFFFLTNGEEQSRQDTTHTHTLTHTHTKRKEKKKKKTTAHAHTYPSTSPPTPKPTHPNPHTHLPTHVRACVRACVCVCVGGWGWVWGGGCSLYFFHRLISNGRYSKQHPCCVSVDTTDAYRYGWYQRVQFIEAGTGLDSCVVLG